MTASSAQRSSTRPASKDPSQGRKDVEAYMAAVPEEGRAALEQRRKTIRSAAPDAEECISYQIPTFKRQGMLVSYAAWKGHCSLYPASFAVMESFKDDLRGYDTASTKGTIRFQAGTPLPIALVKKIVKARIAENEARTKEKASGRKKG